MTPGFGVPVLFGGLVVIEAGVPLPIPGDVLMLLIGERAAAHALPRPGADHGLAPGGLADQAAERRGVSREEALDAQRSRVPIGRYATAEEIASVVVFLCSERASYVAGAAWSADGGVVQVII